MIRPCSCPHTEQDKIHGHGKRVMNICDKGAQVRCTVCGKQYPNIEPKQDKPIKPTKKK